MSALTVLYFILPFPLIFAAHELEEILVQRQWTISHRQKIVKRLPLATAMMNHLMKLDTMAFVIAALEELLIATAVTACVLVDAPYAVHIWTAVFMGFTMHLAIHIAQALILRSYVPGLITTVIILPFAIMCAHSILLSTTTAQFIVITLAGTAIVIANLMLAHKLGILLSARRHK